MPVIIIKYYELRGCQWSQQEQRYDSTLESFMHLYRRQSTFRITSISDYVTFSSLSVKLSMYEKSINGTNCIHTMYAASS